MLPEKKLKRIQFLIPENQKFFLDSVAQRENLSFSALVREIFAEYQKTIIEKELEEAALALYNEYETNDELTAFTALDGEDFL
ncbi:MAG: hypothetical protein HN736_01340 [Anaerolineae bacterium]|jgi:ABC-type multidrug transport system ATPase subunit|nr:hypothetical protein [Anaerolineae bacterium]MBT3713381.1 hypothetical protein [Anaerolineae bacterium]MBT4309487.1 hypothetical protein [Anaerolineae bacterium]MBT4459477.1 hypothetical protein [Anaerolineae bacterium]MBT4842401.1 hypothetical protein [Anaerolineae bacterium]